MMRHAFRNAVPAADYARRAEISRSCSRGAVVIEPIFGWPGIGSLLINSAQNRDYTVVMGLAVFFSVIVVFANLLADILYGVADPRVQYS